MTPSMVSDIENRRLWANARNLQNLADLTARWLDGELPESLTYGGQPEPETGDIPPGLLASLNWAGYLTDCSQPGYDWSPEGDRQRACVSFLLDGVRLANVVDMAVAADLVVIVRRSRWARFQNLRHGYGFPISEYRESSTSEIEVETWSGATIPRSYWRMVGLMWRNPRLSRVLAKAWQVTVFDPEWGRNDRLWDTLAPLIKEVQS